jgi:hypothetical protein
MTLVGVLRIGKSRRIEGQVQLLAAIGRWVPETSRREQRPVAAISHGAPNA